MHPVIKLQNTQNERMTILKEETSPQSQLETPLAVVDAIAQEDKTAGRI